MNKIKNILYLLGLSLAAIGTGCSEPDDELTSIDYDRLFSVTKLEARVVNKTGIRLTWNENKLAEGYVVELFENDSLSFQGTPVMTLEDITENTCTIENLQGELFYSARVQAVSTKTPGSKWATVAIKTGTEQIFLPVDNDELTATEVTLRWTAGQTATEIVLSPGNIRHTVTAGEIAAGAATIGNLGSEITYTAKLMNGEKTRGTITFTTLLDLGGATAIYPEDNLAEIIAAANDGDRFAVFSGTYGSYTKFVVSKNVEIVAARPSDKPVINGHFSIEQGASLTLKNLVLDGTNPGSDHSHAIVFNTVDATYGALLVDGCEIRNYDKGVYYLNVKALVESITINNCVLSDIDCNGADFMDSRSGAIKKIHLTNSTVWRSCAARDLIRYDNASANFPGISTEIKVDRCTFAGVCVGKRLLYTRYTGHTIEFTNNIVANTTALFSDQSATSVPSFSGNNYHNAPNLFSATGSGTTARFFDDSAEKRDPQFEDAANGNFKVQNIDVDAGDPRWQSGL